MDYVEVLSHLIAFDTSVPPGDNYAAAVGYLEPLFRDAGFQTKAVDIPPGHAEGREGRVNLVAHRRAPGKPRLIFYGHIDVVPAEGWPAYQPRTTNGRIYGRGAADMKGAIAALLLGLEACRGKDLKYDTSVMITTDEEYSQASQLRYLKPFLEPVAGASFFDLDSSFGAVSVAGLGVLQMTIRVLGKSVHSGLAHLGENAVEKAVPLMAALLELKNEVVRRRSKIPAFPDTGLKWMEPRLNINMVHGGLKSNIIPDECLISLDRRLIPEESNEDARRELTRAISSVPGLRWEVAREFAITTLPPSEGPEVDALAAIIKAVTGSTGKFGEMGSGDLPSIVTREWGAREFGLGVIRPECNIHGRDEFVYQKDITALAEIIRRFLLPSP
ncbi:MAG: M20/M25/M40 family metallo-hydrolase [Chloroflexi bacterium]|nr:M20/M25/M40 family metallo-hydrolase [Chloroflexota bacterium]